MDAVHNNFTLSDDINGPLLAAVISIEMIAGLITNSFVLILTLSHIKTWKQPSTIFLTNMIISNLVVILFVMPFPLITSAIGEWIFGSTLDQKDNVCKFTAIMNLLCVAVATESLTLLSFDRFFFIVRALQYIKYMNISKAIMAISISWIIAGIISIVPVLGFNVYEFAYSYGTCVPGIEEHVGFAAFAFMYPALLVGSIIVTSVWTFVFIRRYLKTRSSRINFLSSCGKQNNVYVSQENKLIGLFGSLIVVYALCFSPYLCITFLSTFLTVPPIYYTVAFTLCLLQTSLSPLVQFYFRTELRNAVMKRLCKRCFKERERSTNDNKTTVMTTLYI